MDDPNQIEVPASFTQLFASPSGHRLNEPISYVRQRYELCEDLAQMLTEQASAKLFELGIAPDQVLAKMRQGLQGPGSPVQPREAVWIVRRLAELLGWEDPGPA